jgi:hypothetical protein
VRRNNGCRGNNTGASVLPRGSPGTGRGGGVLPRAGQVRRRRRLLLPEAEDRGVAGPRARGGHPACHRVPDHHPGPQGHSEDRGQDRGRAGGQSAQGPAQEECCAGPYAGGEGGEVSGHQDYPAVHACRRAPRSVL